MNLSTLPATPPTSTSSQSWQVRHHRLKQRLVSSTDWEEYGGSCSVQTLLGGFGNLDDNIIDLPGAPYRIAW